MSKKFLTESQVRRFQTLASVPAIHEMDGMPPEEEEMSDDMMPPPMDGEEIGMEPEMEPELEPEMADAPEEGGELDLSPEQKETLAADIVRAVAQELEGALQLDAPIEVAVEDEMAPMAPDGMDDMDPMDDIPPDDGMDMAPEEELPMGDEEEELAEVVDDEDVINEVLRRVIARLQKNK